jgi:hypothetical protein
MAQLSVDNWQKIFSFLGVDDVENVGEVFPAASEAFPRCVFLIVRKGTCRPEFFTSKDQAESRFENLKTSGKEAVLCNWRFRVLESSWVGSCPYLWKVGV